MGEIVSHGLFLARALHFLISESNKEEEMEEEKRYRILIVDDEMNVLRALSRSLRKEPYEVITATSANIALDYFSEKPFDLVISDYMMPKYNGIEFLSRIHEDYPDTIRIILTGYADMDAAIKAINEGGVYRFLTKPWNDEDLKITIRLALEHLALLRENRRLANELKQKNQVLQALEGEHPGISQVKRDEQGRVIL